MSLSELTDEASLVEMRRILEADEREKRRAAFGGITDSPSTLAQRRSGGDSAAESYGMRARIEAAVRANQGATLQELYVLVGAETVEQRHHVCAAVGQMVRVRRLFHEGERQRFRYYADRPELAVVEDPAPELHGLQQLGLGEFPSRAPCVACSKANGQTLARSRVIAEAIGRRHGRLLYRCPKGHLFFHDETGEDRP